MKRLILVGGPMGVGKSAVCRALMERLSRCLYLDGDWCWDASPFQVTEETKAMKRPEPWCWTTSAPCWPGI